MAKKRAKYTRVECDRLRYMQKRKAMSPAEKRALREAQRAYMRNYRARKRAIIPDDLPINIWGDDETAA